MSLIFQHVRILRRTKGRKGSGGRPMSGAVPENKSNKRGSRPNSEADRFDV